MKKNITDRDLRIAWLNVILLSFKKNIVFDYPIPSADRIKDRFDALKSKKLFDGIPEDIISKLNSYVTPDYDSDSELEMYIRHNDHVFGREWFYGYATLYRWRPGQKKKAQELINDALTKKELEAVKKIQKILEFRFDKVEQFKLGYELTNI